MNIVKKNPDMIKFKELSCGDIFKDKNSNYCMKTKYYSDNVNMVYLSHGLLGGLEDDDMVEKVCGVIVVE